MARRPHSIDDLPRTVPIFPLAGALLLPFSHRPLNVFEPRYLAMVDHALSTDRLIGLIQPQDTSEESPAGTAPLQSVGCLGRIMHFDENPEGRYIIVLEGICRFEIIAEQETDTPFRQAAIGVDRFAADFQRGYGASGVDRSRFLKMMRDYAAFADLDMNWEEINQTEIADLVNFCCMVSPYGAAEKQLLLEADTLEDRAETLIAMAEFEMATGGDDKSVALN